MELNARNKLFSSSLYLLYLNRISVYGFNKITGVKGIKSSYNSTSESLFRQARKIVLVIVL